MKPMGTLPPYFATSGAELVMAGKKMSQFIDIAQDTPLFVYDFSVVSQKIALLRAAMPAALGVHYAVKANPFAPLLTAIAPLVDGFDVASAGELAHVAAHAPGRPISFAGPGKRDAALAAALIAGVTINCESEGEVARALHLAEQHGITPRLAVRVNPAFELRGSGMKMGGRASPFGVDAERVPALVRRLIAAGAEWRGFHLFAGSQSLDTAAIIEAQAATLALAADLADAAGAAPPLVNLGGGFGVPYFAGDTQVDVEAVGNALGGAMTSLPRGLDETRFVLELGRWLVAECGVYLTRIVDIKQSRGETFFVTDGGLHHQLAASGNFGTVVRRNYPIALANRMGAAPVQTVNVVGCLCTPLDRLGDQVALPHAQVGDVIAVFMAGAYGRTASPENFLGHPAPVELLAGEPQQS